MVCASANPNSKSRKNVYHIGGVQVEFPYQPYGTQLAFMGRVISTLDRAIKDSHCHALLESPTGTGKSLSLLCSALAWQQNYKNKHLNANANANTGASHSKPDPEAITDPLGHGGGFVPEFEPSGNTASEILETSQSGTGQNDAKNQKKKPVPTIVYSSRTHSQISQVIREYRKTGYRVKMSVLASRKHYCTNPYVRGRENVDEECKLLIKDVDVKCSEFKNVNKVKSHPSVQKGGCHEAFDIEDLVKVGQVVKGCAYYAAISMEDTAELVFCPYSYIVNPIIRGAMDVDINGAIVILDEAHNIEDVARDAGSVDIGEDDLHTLQTELGPLCVIDAATYQPLYEMTQGLISWIEEKKQMIEKPEFKRGFQNYCSCWTGDKALVELQAANISQQCFPILFECAKKAIKVATDKESEVAHISGKSVIILEGLFSSLTYFFSRDGHHIYDYQLALRRYIKRDAGNNSGDWTNTMSLWCLNPSVVFQDVAELSLSVILTSGTLSPMNSFSSELGVKFGTSLEAPHVIDVEAQVWAAVISTGPGNYPLNASYKTADGYAFQDALGKTLEEICKIVPGGALLFFPSYKLMEKLCDRWHETGQWSRLNSAKQLFVEPRGGGQEELEPVLKGYYETIQKGSKPTIGRKRCAKNMKLSQQNKKNASENYKKGAAFLAVCRGKVSEGIDFSDDNARVVIIVGIPFPNINDFKVSSKKKYNDTYKSSKNLLSGSEWYCHQAFRALNQAAGRCIRHKLDYGGIILIDERYQEERNQAYISKWLRKSIRQYNDFEMSLEGLKSFFTSVKERLSNTVEISQNCGINSAISLKDQSNRLVRKKSDKINQSKVQASAHVYEGEVKGQNCEKRDCYSMDGYLDFSVGKNQKVSSCNQRSQVISDQYDAISTQSITEVKTSAPSSKKIAQSSISYIDLECSSLTSERIAQSSVVYIDLECSSLTTRFSGAPSVPLPCEDHDVVLVKETPNVDSVTERSPLSSKDAAPNRAQNCIDSPNHKTLHQTPTNSSKYFSRTQEFLASPDKNISTNTSNPIPEMESPMNWSVNSHARKRRQVMGLPLPDQNGKQPHAQTPDCTSLTSSTTSRDVNCRNEFGVDNNYTENTFVRSNGSVLSTNTYATSWESSTIVMDKKLQIACSICKSPLGLPDNSLYVTCSITSSTKVHLSSLLKARSTPPSIKKASASIPVLVTETSSIDQRVFRRTIEGATGQGIWCEEDGCVYNTIFCPYCCTSSNILGVQIMATDASNICFLNKAVFYVDQLEIKDHDASNEKDSLPVDGSSVDRVSALNLFDKFSYSPNQQNSGGWRTTKTKLRLPRKG